MSEAAAAAEPSSSGRKSSSPTTSSLAWLVHSQDSISRSLPPDIDDKPLVRQKRRRTSPEDQKILEEEFRRNPRPDKATRQSIVQRVALGEKEVQIWFQNRRQNSRRKAQPLSNDEILDRLHSKVDDPDCDIPNETNLSSEDDKEDENVLVTGDSSHTIPPQACAPLRKLDGDTPGLTSVGDDGQEPIPATCTSSNDLSQRSIGTTMTADPASSQSLASSQDLVPTSSAKTGYLANRRSASFVQTKSFDGTMVSISQESHNDSRVLKRSRSLRLSMTSDGAAKVINPNSPTPSPPRSQPVAPPVGSAPRTGGLRRSFSTAELNDKVKQAEDDLFSRKAQRTSSGRSRDSRAWEFWCDSEARNSLTEKANQESSGSAADAIGLIRSTSRTAASKALESKKKEVLARRGAGARRAGAFSRSNTVAGRLPSETRRAENVKHSVKSKTGKEGEEDAYERPNTDSDKENWEPPKNGSQPSRRRPITAARPRHANRTILGENLSVPSQSGSLGAMMEKDGRLQSARKRPDTKLPELDDEVASFMGDTRSRPETRQGSDDSVDEDMDCIQGLLSLSKGMWA